MIMVKLLLPHNYHNMLILGLLLPHYSVYGGIALASLSYVYHTVALDSLFVVGLLWPHCYMFCNGVSLAWASLLGLHVL